MEKMSDSGHCSSTTADRKTRREQQSRNFTTFLSDNSTKFELEIEQWFVFHWYKLDLN